MKRIFLMGAILLTLQPAIACDICGCSSGNYFLGPFPQFRKHFFGLRYSFRSFHSQVANDASQYSKDFYQAVELWGGVNIGRKWQLLGFVPYSINKQTSDDGTRRSNGLGDVTLIANYKLMDKRSGDAHDNMISQQLWIGGGVKLPTGKFAANPDDIIPDANNQPGSGSVDFILNAMYSFHINDWGINSDVNYKMNQGASGFRFGNRFNTSVFVFHSIASKKTTFNPNAGLLYENLQANSMGDAKITQTGGNALLAAAGLEVNFSKMAVGFNAQLPVSQHLSDGQTTTTVRGMAHVTFLF